MSCYRCAKRRRKVVEAVLLTAFIFVGMCFVAAVLTYGPAVDAWAAAERERALQWAQ